MLTEGFFLCHEFGKSSPCFATHSLEVLWLWLAGGTANTVEPATRSCICVSAVPIHLQSLPSANCCSWGASGRRAILKRICCTAKKLFPPPSFSSCFSFLSHDSCAWQEMYSSDVLRNRVFPPVSHKRRRLIRVSVMRTAQ